MSCNWRIALSGLFLMLGLLSNKESTAGDWLIEPSVAAASSYHDNRQMSLTSKKTSVENVGEASAKITYRRPTYQIDIKPKVKSLRYMGLENLDSDNQYLDGGIAKQMEAANCRASGSFARDNTLTSEQETTGFIDVQKRRLSRNTNASCQLTVNATNSLNVNLSKQAVRYQDGAQAGLVDYDYLSAQAGWRWVWSEKSDISLTLFGNEFEAITITNNSKTTGAQIDWTYTLDPTNSFSLSLGGRKTLVEGLTFGIFPFEQTSRGSVVNARWTKAIDRGSFNWNLVRRVDPSGDGFLYEVVGAVFSLNYQIMPQVQWDFLFDQYRSEPVQETPINQNRRYGNIRWSYRWRLDETKTVNFGARMRSQKFERLASSANDLSIFISLVFQDAMQLN